LAERAERGIPVSLERNSRVYIVKDMLPFVLSDFTTLQEERSALYNRFDEQWSGQYVTDPASGRTFAKECYYPEQYREERKTYQENLAALSVPLTALVERNKVLIPGLVDNSSHQELLLYEIDRVLAEHFPILGQGTTSLVFDLGSFVLKRTIEDDRQWDGDYSRWHAHRNLFAPTAEVVLDTEGYGEYSLQAQEKLVTIDPFMYREVIHDLYFPELEKELFVRAEGAPDWRTWEWGLSLMTGKPLVYDWG
jgi:hypothetical protein